MTSHRIEAGQDRQQIQRKEQWQIARKYSQSQGPWSRQGQDTCEHWHEGLDAIAASTDDAGCAAHVIGSRRVPCKEDPRIVRPRVVSLPAIGRSHAVQ